MRIYNVTGTACETLNAAAIPFSINVCALNTRDAYDAAYGGMYDRGYLGVVCAHADNLGAPGRYSTWRLGDTLQIS